MNDPRVAEAQALHWEIETLRTLGVTEGFQVVAKHRRIAGIYEDRARDLLGAGDTRGWPDLFAAITHAALGGLRSRVDGLVAFGRERAAAFTGRESLEAEVVELEAWARALPEGSSALPPLASFARSLPPLGSRAA